MAMICPQGLPPLVELLGTVEIDAPPAGSPPGSPNIVRKAPLLGATPISEAAVKQLGPGTWYVYRKTTYTFAEKKSKCLAMVKYDECQYFQDVQVYIVGPVATGNITLYGPQRSPDLKDGDWEASGVCWEGLVDVAKTGAGFIPHPSLKSRLETLSSKNSTELVELIDPNRLRALVEPPLVAPRISRSAFEAIATFYANARRQSPEPFDLPSFRSGAASLADVARDLASLHAPMTRELSALFSRLQTMSIRASEGAFSDDIWTLEARLAIRNLTSDDWPEVEDCGGAPFDQDGSATANVDDCDHIPQGIIDAADQKAQYDAKAKATFRCPTRCSPIQVSWKQNKIVCNDGKLTVTGIGVFRCSRDPG